jgi:glycerol transport system ATP-binding protein
MSIRLESVNVVSMGESVISEVSLTIERGTMNVLLGPTLAGKTTLMRLMAGLDKPTSGRILVDGKDVTGVPVRERSVAMVYQEFVNYPSFTVYENIAAPLRRAKRRLSAPQIDAKVRAIAQMMHIDHLLHRLPSELSGGQQQRVALARALVKEAPLLLLDEPLHNLDYKLREELRSEIRGIFHGGTTTVVYATTEPQEALLFGGNTIVLDAGRVLQSGPALEIYHRPATIRASEVFSDPPINLIRAVIGPQGCRLSPSVAFPLPQHMRALPPGDYRVGVRADHIGLAGHAEYGCLIPAKVELAEINGSETYVHAGHGDFKMIALLQGVHEFGLGDEIKLYLDPRRLFVFDSAGNLVAAPGENAGGTGAH